MTATTQEERILQLVRQKGVLRSKELNEYGLFRANLQRLLGKGLLVRTERGVYTLPAASGISEYHGFAEAAKRVPHCVVCLLSALTFHGITTQTPHAVWVAIDEKVWRPKIEQANLRIVTFSGHAFEEGIERHDIEGVSVPIYSLAKTIADCFKYRNKIGMDVALEALREAKRERRCSNDDIYRYAKVCRVWNVMKPYLEALS